MEQIFNIGKWQYLILQTLRAYRELYSYVQNTNAVRKHMDELEVHTITEDGSLIRDNNPKIRDSFVKGPLRDLEKSIAIYSRQMIVTSITYFEAMLKEFFFALFSKYPKRMHEYVLPPYAEHSKGYVSLSEILEYQNLNNLLANLSERAASNVVKGTLQKIISKVEKLAKVSIDKNLTSQLDQLHQTRNKIVHENLHPDVSYDDVIQSIDVVFEFLGALGKACVEANIPHDDPGNLLGKNPDPEEPVVP